MRLRRLLAGSALAGALGLVLAGAGNAVAHADPTLPPPTPGQVEPAPPEPAQPPPEDDWQPPIEFPIPVPGAG